MGALKKPNGYLNLLDLNIQNCDGQDYRLIKTLDDYKDNISALVLPFSEDLGSDWVSFLQHENTRFPLLEKLSINDEKLIVENLLKKHAEQLTYLNLNSDDRLNFSHYYPKLETLIVYNIHPDDLVSLLSLCSESLSTLRIHEREDMSAEERSIQLQQLPELSKLKTLETSGETIGETVKSLISKCRQTLTGICFSVFDLELEEKYFPKLKYLKFWGVDNVDVIQDMISANACQLKTLILYDIDYMMLSNPLSNIKNVYINYCEDPVNILKCASSVQCLVLEQLVFFKDIQKMLSLTDVYLLNFKLDGMNKGIKDLLVKNADTLEFLVFHFRNTIFETMESTPPVELLKVHTLIILPENPLLESEREFYKSLCPNAQIMINNGNGGEYILETVKSRLKYHKADDLFCQEINDSINRTLKALKDKD